MKILALMSSFRKQGNTARIVQMIEGQMEEIAARHDEPLDFETLHLAHMDIEICRGCRTCFDRGEENARSRMTYRPSAPRSTPPPASSWPAPSTLTT